jgi:mono/diheme cytochrome c family protein
MAKSISYLFIAVALSMAAGCATPPKSGEGFTLPQGDARAGKQIFIDKQCTACHKISGMDQIAVGGGTPQMSIALGGDVTRIQTYGELVTSIINPSHRLAKGYPLDEISVDGQSRMRNYNDVMTITELTDLVTFLQSKYKLQEFVLTDYPVYTP